MSTEGHRLTKCMIDTGSPQHRFNICIHDQVHPNINITFYVCLSQNSQNTLFDFYGCKTMM